MYGAFFTSFPYSKADFDMPRSRIITLAVYAKHMLKYQDNQFGCHPLFHYYVFNRIIKEQALNITCFLCGRLDKNSLSLNKLSDLINGNGGNQLVNKIVWYVWQLKGTRPYWRQKRNKFTAYTENIKSGSLFFILSAADLLHFYIPQFDEYKAANKAQCYWIAF